MTKTYQGSCHCGAVRYEAELDLSRGVSRCNCSICTKLGSAGVLAKPHGVRLVAGANLVSEYRATPESPNRRIFCSRCGVHLFGDGDVPELGGRFASVNTNTLDGVELTALPVGYFDGRHDNWQAGTRPQPWPILAQG